MSVRSSEPGYLAAQQLRQDIARAGGAAEAERADLEQLTEVASRPPRGRLARSACPIGWINEAHYAELLKNNSLSGSLTQQIEAYKVVASQ